MEPSFTMICSCGAPMLRYAVQTEPLNGRIRQVVRWPQGAPPPGLHIVWAVTPADLWKWKADELTGHCLATEETGETHPVLRMIAHLKGASEVIGGPA